MPMRSRRVALIVVSAVVALVLTAQPRATSPRFFADDPLNFDPETQDASAVKPWDVNDQYDFIENTFFDRGEESDVRALNVNTVDEVPESSWFEGRLGHEPLSVEALVRGPMTSNGPVPGPWTVIAGKSEGISPGLTIRDAEGTVYFVKFDPPANPEMATGAEVISTRFFHALGYHVPENYLAVIRREDLQIDPKARIRGPDGEMHAFTPDDIDDVLDKAASREDGSYRVVASKGLAGEDLGPFRYWGTRPDDPNDIFPHEHHRELRGLRVFAAWLNHDDARSVNTRDFLIERNGRRIVWHYLLDFGSTLGSGSTQAQRPRAGNEYIWEARPTFVTMLTLGFYVRPWLKVKYPEMPAVGRIEADFFQPARWKPEYPNPAFDNVRPDDAFWAARRVAGISDEAIRAVVATGEYSDPAAARYLTDVLIKRRDKVAGLWLNGVLPVVDLALDRDGVLTFRNLAVDAGLADAPAEYRVRWFRFDNAAGTTAPVGDEQRAPDVNAKAPADVLESDYLMTELRASHPVHAGWSTPLRAYFHRESGGWKLVGLERQ
jgi:hypothetical protein